MMLKKINSPMKVHSTVFLSLLLASCTNKIVLDGKYASQESPYGFVLKSDSTFEYKFYQFHAYEYSSGKWYRKNSKSIVLNSGRSNTDIPLIPVSIIQLRDSSTNKFSFDFSSNGIAAKDCECAIIINDTSKVIRRCDSISLINIEMIVNKLFVEVRKSPLQMTSFRFSLYPLVTNVFSPLHSKGNVVKLKIIINDSLFSYRVFNSEKIGIRRRGLSFYDSKRKGKYWVPKLN